MKGTFLVLKLLLVSLALLFAKEDVQPIYLPVVIGNSIVKTTPSATSTPITPTPTQTPLPTITPSPTVTTPCTPTITVTHIPRYGSTEQLEGMVTCVSPSAYKVAVYIFVGGWWNKPTFSNPLTPIQPDNKWKTSVVSGGSDECATQLAAFLVPNGTTVPELRGAQKLSQSLFDIAAAHIIVNRESQLRMIQFSGYTWRVKACEKPLGPDNNFFSDRSEDVWVDAQGQLHMRIAFRNNKWYATEVIATESLGHGIYTFTTASRVDLLDKNVVLGLFTWQDAVPENNYREIDIEFSRWGQATGPNAQYVVQPYFHPGNRHQFTMNLQGNDSTHRFLWRDSQVDFASFQGSGATIGDPIESWTYTGPDTPLSGQETPRINLWLIGHAPPSNGQEVEVIISSFSYTPLIQ